MPVYTLKNTKTNKEWDITCSYQDLQFELKKKNIEQVLKFPGMVGSTKSNLTRAGGDWQDLLKNMKKKSGRGNSINV
jgi:hypothetical protein|tara:strand:- start:6072 stop:6302 length:231 start_codon:yes stop_codon:yes gene_type:complete